MVAGLVQECTSTVQIGHLHAPQALLDLFGGEAKLDRPASD